MFGRIGEVKDYQLNKWDYQFFTRGIYAVDDIAKWKIGKKIRYMTVEECDKYSLRIVKLYLDTPEFRLKSNKKTLSKKGELIKKLIREAYKGKVDHYFHDIIIHIGDNFYQNQCICKLMTMPQIDVRTILNHIWKYQYVITKTDVPYMPSDFPEHYPLGKDIDIICSDADEYHKVLCSIVSDVKCYEESYIIRKKTYCDKSGNEYRTLVRLEQEGQFLAFLFDISCRTGRLAPDFSKAMVDNRYSNNGYFIPSQKFELIVRLDEINKNHTKIHHQEYIKKHKAEIDVALCNRYLSFNWKKYIN